MKEQLNTGQLEAFERIVGFFKNRETTPLILSGFGGTGKSFVIQTVLKELIGYRIARVAFTGRAASHLSEGITCHSLLYKPEMDSKGNLVRFVHKERDEILEVCADGIIVDESSMIPSKMFDELMSIGVPVLWVGDIAQLPPIDNDHPGFNVMDMEAEKLILDQNMRVHDDSYGIHELCDHLRSSNTIPRRKFSGVKYVAKGKTLTLDFHKNNRFDYIICGTNKTRKKFNDLVRNARGYGGETPEVGEQVICLKNNVSNYNRVNNGEVYIVEGIIPESDSAAKYMLRNADKKEQTVSVVVENDTWYTEAATNPKKDVFTFGYAMTCHKAQGASIDSVLFYDENVSFFLDSQKFKYTACSRASKRLTIAI